ncbi:hypothetical protein [Agrobacterium cavarae]|uniref:hypothetical protein n=1 Tax=Agrobacterium cavarae TaxID=2528239 RepID=UPI003FD5F28B
MFRRSSQMTRLWANSSPSSSRVICKDGYQNRRRVFDERLRLHLCRYNCSAVFRFGLVPELAPASVALSFDTKKQVHDGKIYPSRRAHMGFDEAGILYGRLDEDLFRIGIEKHFHLVIDRVHAKTKFSRAALWRLFGTRLLNAFWMPACGSTQSKLQRCAS